VGGSPARVSDPTASPNPLHGVLRARPRSSSRSSAPVAASIPADEVNSRDLASVWVTTCSVAASSPAATRRRSPVADPRSGQRDAEADHDEPGVLDAGVRDHPGQPVLHRRVGDTEQRARRAEHEHLQELDDRYREE